MRMTYQSDAILKLLNKRC